VSPRQRGPNCVTLGDRNPETPSSVLKRAEARQLEAEQKGVTKRMSLSVLAL
jgi:hypothetical protein